MHMKMWKQLLSEGKKDQDLTSLYGEEPGAQRERALSLLEEFEALFGDMDV